MADLIDVLIPARTRDLGGFSVGRVLPFAAHRMVGPFIFFDHMGPAELKAHQAMDVRPHPHINLATVTYLFEGRIHHRDSLGSNQIIEPGAVNWMTAGRGIVHSERTPEPERSQGSRVNGIQLWVALPESAEELPPSFMHHPKECLPEFHVGLAHVRLLLGEIFDYKSPVHVHSPLFYAEVHLPQFAEISIPLKGFESAFYVVSGEVQCGDVTVPRQTMAVTVPQSQVVIKALQDSHLMLIGGSTVGPRFIDWNFVSSSQERLAEARQLWAQGPQIGNSRFMPIPGDDSEYIAYPANKS